MHGGPAEIVPFAPCAMVSRNKQQTAQYESDHYDGRLCDICIDAITIRLPGNVIAFNR
jgi:hypothetical protein